MAFCNEVQNLYLITLLLPSTSHWHVLMLNEHCNHFHQVTEKNIRLYLIKKISVLIFFMKNATSAYSYPFITNLFEW